MPVLFASQMEHLITNYMRQQSLIKFLYLQFVLLSVLGLSSCQEGELDLGDDFISFPTYTALIDTVTIQLSTFKEDSVITSGTNHALIGFYHHPIMGGQEAKAYFSLNYPTDYSWDDEKQVFDSLVMILRTNAYSIGDTTINASFSAYRLNEQIVTNTDGKLYSTSSFNYYPDAMAQKRFRPYPNQEKRLTMRMNDDFALEMIEFFKTYDNHTDKKNLFDEQFNGFVIQCDTNLTRAAIGFEVNDTACCLRMYSHTTGLEQKNIVDDFSLGNSTYQFNQLTSPNTSVIFNQPSNRKEVIKAKDSGNISLLQSGAGLKFRIDFPTLNNLLELKNMGYIIKAELRLKPDMAIMRTSDLPETIYIGEIYRANEIWGYLTDSDGNTLTSELHTDRVYHENTYYSFDLTSYINTRLQEDVVDTDQGLAINLPDADMGSTFNWLAINGQSTSTNASQLLLYYYYYDTE